jgi:hypothetical protein
MGKLDKFREIFKVGVAVSKPFIPPTIGSVLDVVSKSVNDKDDPANEKALEALARDNDAQTAAILALHERVKKLEGK